MKVDSAPITRAEVLLRRLQTLLIASMLTIALAVSAGIYAFQDFIDSDNKQSIADATELLKTKLKSDAKVDGRYLSLVRPVDELFAAGGGQDRPPLTALGPQFYAERHFDIVALADGNGDLIFASRSGTPVAVGEVAPLGSIGVKLRAANQAREKENYGGSLIQFGGHPALISYAEFHQANDASGVAQTRLLFALRFFDPKRVTFIARYARLESLTVDGVAPDEEPTGGDRISPTTKVAIYVPGFEGQPIGPFQWTQRLSAERLANYLEPLMLVILLTVSAALGALATKMHRVFEGAINERTSAINEKLAAAEAANKSKSSFLAMVSHELRTPLTGLLGILNTLDASKLDAHDQKMLRVANDAGIGLSKNLNDLLDISKIDAGQLDFQPTRFSPYHLIQSTMALLREGAQKKGLSLIFTHGEALEPALFLMADALRIQQVLVNILGNAIKFSESGDVTIHGDISGLDGPVQFSIEVGDTGIGIDPDIAGRLFDPFVQGQNLGAGHRAGLGLGLSICKKIIDAMGGSITVSTNAPRGTRVRVVVPCAPGASDVDVAADDGKVAKGDALRILIVDDNPVNALIAVALVEKMGHVGTSVNSGEAALAAVAIGNLDLVLMDILMPGIDGIEAARRIRQLPAPMGRIPIIAITASPTDDIKLACDAAGIQSVQSKPFQVVELSAAIQQFGHPVVQA